VLLVVLLHEGVSDLLPPLCNGLGDLALEEEPREEGNSHLQTLEVGDQNDDGRDALQHATAQLEHELVDDCVSTLDSSVHGPERIAHLLLEVPLLGELG